MKKSEIRIGHTYSNGRGRERRVIDIGPQYKSYGEQESVENLRYEVVKDGSVRNRTMGSEHNMTITEFAAWAKVEVG